MPYDLDDVAWAKAWIKTNLDVSRETLEQLEQFCADLVLESRQQNLISASTVPMLWSRHIVDSLQLLQLLPENLGRHEISELRWLDLGSGAGFPAIPIALVTQARFTLVESRALRCAFLQKMVDTLGLESRVKVRHCKLEQLPDAEYSVISARAFAPLPKLLALAGRFSTEKTTWLLPKGQNADKELELIPVAWQSRFESVLSVTSADARILMANGAFNQPKPPIRTRKYATKGHIRHAK
jgi:16S rRNA (guanine527-N7)-methyltransferase